MLQKKVSGAIWDPQSRPRTWTLKLQNPHGGSRLWWRASLRGWDSHGDHHPPVWLRIDICSTNPWNWVTGSRPWNCWNHLFKWALVMPEMSQKTTSPEVWQAGAATIGFYVASPPARARRNRWTERLSNNWIKMDHEGNHFWWWYWFLMMILIDVPRMNPHSGQNGITFASLLSKGPTLRWFLWHSRPFSYRRFRWCFIQEWSRWRLPARVNV